MADRACWSVALATHNGARFLGEQLASIAAQSLLPAELIVVDDASSDESRQLIGDFADNAPFPVRLIANPEQSGAMATFGRAIAETSGDLIAFCDQDDVWEPNKLAALGRLFADQPSAGLVFSNAATIDDDGRPLGWDTFGAGQLDWTPEVRAEFAAGRAFMQLRVTNRVMGCCAAIRATYKPLVLPFPAEAELTPGLIHDGWTAMLISAVADIAWTDEQLVRYRVHANQAVSLSQQSYQLKPHEIRPPLDRTLLYQRRRGRPLLDRLNEHAAALPVRPAVRAALEDEVAHFEARLAIAAEGRGAVKTYLHELRRGGYGRWSEGWRGAARDLTRVVRAGRPVTAD